MKAFSLNFLINKRVPLLRQNPRQLTLGQEAQAELLPPLKVWSFKRTMFKRKT